MQPDLDTIYKRCSQAAAELADRPAPFIDIDVVMEVVEGAPLMDEEGRPRAWSEEDVREAKKHANQICGVMYRALKVVRFGPVKQEDTPPDYVRSAGRIVLWGTDTAPAKLETPNGTFARITNRKDKLGSVGRRKNSTRDDLKSWDEQQPADGEMLVDAREMIPKIEALEAEIRKLKRENADLRKANALHTSGGNGSNGSNELATVKTMIGEIKEQLDSLTAA